MNNDKFFIQSIFLDTLTNGFRDEINSNPERLGFVLGAIDCGFAVNKTGALRAKKGAIEIYLGQIRDTGKLRITIFKKQEKIIEFEYSSDSFLWDKVKIEKGRLLMERKDNPNRYEFICSTT